MNAKTPQYKTVYSLKIRTQLREEGFEPLMEKENEYKSGLKCWIYEATEEFNMTFDKLMRRCGYGKH